MLAILARSGHLLPRCLTFGPRKGPGDFCYVIDRRYSPGNTVSCASAKSGSGMWTICLRARGVCWTVCGIPMLSTRCALWMRHPEPALLKLRACRKRLRTKVSTRRA
eukprot:13364294-Alexandrium_andersonii.AAC.1